MVVFYTLLLDKWTWPYLYEGRRYWGEVKDGVPHGYGIMAYTAADTDKITSLYVGGFENGVRSGRGFMLNLDEQIIIHERPATYEDVMETAEFDSCGRPIHYASIHTVQTRELRREWLLAKDGLWADDHYTEAVKRDFTPWEKCALHVSWYCLENGEVKYHHLDREENISKRGKKGTMDLDGIFFSFLTPLPDGRLLVLDDSGGCRAMSPGDEWTLDTRDSRYIYQLLKK